MAGLAILTRPPLKVAFRKGPNLIKHTALKQYAANLSCAIIDVPGKGKGMMATKFIARGNLIFKEKPILRTPLAPGGPDNIRHLFAKFPDKDKEELLVLPIHPEEVKTKDDIVPAIVKSNAVRARLGVFPNNARVNHGCGSAFNVVHIQNDTEMALHVHGETFSEETQELLSNYLMYSGLTLKPREERQEFLSSHYHFHCALSESQSRESDSRLKRVSTLHDDFNAWHRGEIDGGKAIEIINQIWELGEQEGYTGERREMAAAAGLVATAHADPQAARQWYSLAAQWSLYRLEGENDQAKLDLQWAAKPDQYSSWGSKNKP